MKIDETIYSLTTVFEDELEKVIVDLIKFLNKNYFSYFNDKKPENKNDIMNKEKIDNLNADIEEFKEEYKKKFEEISNEALMKENALRIYASFS